MIISHKHKFIFIKTAKTAGTSIEVFLSQHCGQNDILTPIYPLTGNHVARNYRGIWNPLPEIRLAGSRALRANLRDFLRFRKYYNHIAAMYVRNRVGPKIWDSYFKFCVDRNPWDKTLSHYHMRKDRTDKNLSLDGYFAAKKFCFNFPRYTDPDGQLLVDRVLRYEHLNAELGSVFSQLGIAFSGKLEVRAKSEHRRDRRPYQEVFNSEQIRLIEEAFATEININGYSAEVLEQS